jgi:hypothetical protein
LHGADRDSYAQYQTPALSGPGPTQGECQSASAIAPYAFQLSGWFKTEATKSRKQRRNLKQLREDLLELGVKEAYDRVAAFARQ